LPLRALSAAPRARFGLALAAALFAVLAIPAFASAAKVPLTVEKSGTGQGTVTSSPAGISCGTSCESKTGEFVVGTTVTLTESPQAGSYFEGWFGCDSEPTANTCKITVHEEEETYVEAEFNEIEKFPLVLEKSGTGQGTVTSSPAGISCNAACPTAEYEYLEGTKATLTASPAPGSVFEGWTGCTKPSGAKCEVTIAGETIVQAIFGVSSIPQVTLGIDTAGTGTGTVTCNGGSCLSSYDQGTNVTIAATAASGSSFAGFSGGGCSGTGNCIVTINSNTTVTATFNADKAKAAGSARVKGGKANLKITCSGGPCQGKLNLSAKVKGRYKAKSVIIGKGSFDLADGASTMVKIKLFGVVNRELSKGKAVEAKLAGTAILSSTVKLTPAKK
jgi:hypothetical protein